MRDRSVLLMAMGLAMMAGWLVLGLRHRRLALTCVIFASSPAFQLFWTGFALPYGKTVIVVPGLAVPAVTVVGALLYDRRRRQKRDSSRRDE